MEGCDENKETINSVISKLFRKAEFDLEKAQRGIIFLDGMDKIGENVVSLSEIARKQVIFFLKKGNANICVIKNSGVFIEKRKQTAVCFDFHGCFK